MEIGVLRFVVIEAVGGASLLLGGRKNIVSYFLFKL